MAVPTTETALDRMAEAKRLGEEVTRLKGIAEIAQRDVQGATAALTQALNRVNQLENTIQSLSNIVSEASQNTSLFLRKCEGVIRASQIKCEEIVRVIEIIGKRIGVENEHLEYLKKKSSEVHYSIVRENESLDVKKRDLDIYHSRLKEHFEKYLPGQKITI